MDYDQQIVCEYMVTSTPQMGRLALHKNVSLNGQSISEVDKTTFLGVVVDKYLSWKDIYFEQDL